MRRCNDRSTDKSISAPKDVKPSERKAFPFVDAPTCMAKRALLCGDLRDFGRAVDDVACVGVDKSRVRVRSGVACLPFNLRLVYVSG